MTSSDFAVEACALSKAFGTNRAVDGIDLRVRKGSIFGILGPNGAGKTTFIRMLATLIPPDSGRATVLGHDIEKEADIVRGRISLTGQFASVDEDLSGRENLVILALLHGLGPLRARRRARDLMESFDLQDAAKRQVKTYSGGMRRRLDIAASLIRTPELLFLDEPTTGLDPRSRNQVWGMIRRLAAEGTTILLTTQYLEEADQLADRIAVFDRGHVIAEGTSAELKASVGSGVLHIRLADASERSRAVSILQTMLRFPVHPDGDPRSITAQLSDTARAIEALSALRSAGLTVSDFSLGQPSLDEVFFALTGHGAEQVPQSTSDPLDDVQRSGNGVAGPHPSKP
jgi:ABC-2 type transport system ATP-binding protein